MFPTAAASRIIMRQPCLRFLYVTGSAGFLTAALPHNRPRDLLLWILRLAQGLWRYSCDLSVFYPVDQVAFLNRGDRKSVV